MILQVFPGTCVDGRQVENEKQAGRARRHGTSQMHAGRTKTSRIYNAGGFSNCILPGAVLL